MSNETISTQPLGTPAVKLGEAECWFSNDSWTRYKKATIKVCPKSIKLYSQNGEYCLVKPTKKSPLTGTVVEFHGNKAIWMGVGNTSYGVAIWNKGVPRTYEEVVERFNAKDNRDKKVAPQNRRLFIHEFLLLTTPEDKVEYRLVPSVSYYITTDGRNFGPYTHDWENPQPYTYQQGPMTQPDWGVLIETWVWWAGRIPMKVKNGMNAFNTAPQNWIRLQEFRNASLNTPPRAFNEVETTIRNKHNDLKEELAAAVFHPSRMVRMMETYGEDWDERV